ncbi:tRNA (adenosine(37)-N6)-threonylcarbamoyltransferase complex ATPase subunit type 1 TsaE [Frigoribacterium sp. ACAM 257]|nr:tRNA (adenosine(37)-N6)-threonylcarbamoyltransferase complex ATPase subunit type 1 TsaE [Frigoribacterium sp. ACAM 257]TWX38932.1 tRNA (adenosine(37)-N6)-threonylcarbamoyltransferase complex ATPase subunit type 1 TsaE [Frigoribacterium sp. ACAM 257]
MLFAGDLADTEATEALGRRLAGLLRAGDLLVLTGPLGAGKTTLTRGLGAGLNVRGQVASPTFVLARTHPTGSGVPLVHVDAYRLGGADELDDLDLDYEGSVVVVEWGAGLLDGVAESWLDVVIERPTGAGGHLSDGDRSDGDRSDGVDALDDRDPDDVPDEPRRLTVTAHGPRWSGVPALVP